MWHYWLVLVLQTLASVHCSILHWPKIKLGPQAVGDAGKPLFLTQYIEHGNITKGRRLARVPFTESLYIKSYAGYFTVNKAYNSNQFFWFFPAKEPQYTKAPVVVWLQGGPGASSLYGVFIENGPLKVKNGKFERRKYNWALSHNMIYIDNPVGTGFSFTNDSKGYCTNENQVGEQLYTLLIQFFQLFPELQQSKFYVTGESYAGKYVPALAYTIHKRNPTAKLKINLKGIAIGNGLCDPIHQLLYSKYLYQIGLIDWNQAQVFEEYENKTVEYIKNQKWEEAFNNFDYLINGDYFGKKSILNNMTEFNFYYNFLHSKHYNISDDFGAMLQKSYVRKGIHVGDLPFSNGSLVEDHLKQDFMKSVAPWLSELLDHYKVLIYSGQLDIIIAYPLTVNYLRNLNFTGSKKYKTAKRYIWKVDGDVAGYVKQAGKLVEILVRNAGHMVPGDQPKWALDMITRFTHEKPYITSSSLRRLQA